MNGFVDHGLNEADFGEPEGISVKSFDAFRKSNAFRYYHLISALMPHVLSNLFSSLTSHDPVANFQLTFPSQNQAYIPHTIPHWQCLDPPTYRRNRIPPHLRVKTLVRRNCYTFLRGRKRRLT